MSFFEKEEFREFVSTAFDETVKHTTIEEMAEFALGSVGDAVVQFLGGNRSDIYILTFSLQNGQKKQKRLRLDLLSKEIDFLLEFNFTIDDIVKL